MDFYDKNDYNLQDLNDFIQLEVEENRHLDYKDGEALAPNEISEITKDVSSFANSDGGIIIYGVGEDKKTHTPNSYAPIINPKITKEWLEQKINIIQPKIKGVLIFPIRLNKKATKSIYIVKIPKSDDAAGIAEIQNQQSIKDIYILRGIKTKIMQQGLNIIRMSDGITKKVWVK